MGLLNPALLVLGPRLNDLVYGHAERDLGSTLAFAAANDAAIPSVALGNFTWDWIYSAYPAFSWSAPDVIPIIRDAYAHATVALRLPFHGGFDAMAAVTDDVPLVAFFLARIGVVTHRTLLAGARYAIVGIFILAAVLTPGPDVASQLLMAGPLLLLYGVSIGVAWAARPRDAVAAVTDATPSASPPDR